MGDSARGALGVGNVVEYLGLPGVGKTWQLGDEGYCARVGGRPSPVPVGLSMDKLLNTAYGLLINRRLLSLLIRSAEENSDTQTFRSAFRSIAIVFERIGRVARLRREMSDRDVHIHIDEGPLQSIWRAFCEKRINERNLFMMEASVKALRDIGTSVCYVSCPEVEHIRRVLKREKKSHMDLKIAHGDYAAYRLGREWMAALLWIMRRLEIDVVYVRTLD